LVRVVGSVGNDWFWILKGRGMSDGSQVSDVGDARWQGLVAESLPGIVWSTDTDLRIVTCQGGGLSMFFGTAADFRGKTLFDVFCTTDSHFPPIAAHHRALSGISGPIVFTLANTTFHGYVAPLRSQSEIAGCVTSVRDDLPNDARRESIIDTVLDLIIFLDTDGTIQEVNRAATGLPRDHVAHRPVYDFVPAESHEPLRQAIESVLETNRVAALEVRFVRRFGQSSWQLMRIGPVRLHGKTTGLVLLASDITQQKLAIQRLEAEEELLRDLLELQDRERRMVAYEIHDGFIQDVVGARMILQGLKRSLTHVDAAVVKQFDGAVSLLAHAVNEGRRLISELRPMIIDEMGIIDAMEFLVGEEEARGDMEIRFAHRVQHERLPALLQATIFRITRESLNNARRHGVATRIDIRLTQIGAKYLILEIQDNGVGFNLDAVPSDRYGLAGIRERAQLFGGGATIESSPDKGTRITVKLSLDVPAEDHGSNHPDWTA
jgi:PAS domain S-box-containing protein